MEDTPTKTIQKRRRPVAKAKRFKSDPNCPKKSESGYFLFMRDVRAKVRADNPKAKIGELGKIMGQKWKQLTPEVKQPYLDRAAELKAAFQIRKAAYDKTPEKKQYDQEKIAWNKIKTRFKSDPNAPKQPQTGYFLFMTKVRADTKLENPDVSVAQLAKIMGGKWNALTEDVKKPFLEEAAQLRAEYKKVKAKYDQSDEKLQYDREKAEHEERENLKDIKEMKGKRRTVGSKRKAAPIPEPEEVSSSEEDDDDDDESSEGESSEEESSSDEEM